MKPKLAIISTYDELCGIASYTRVMEKNLSDLFDITVFDLDQFILKSTGKKMERLGDKEIQNIAKQLPKFDSVNIQLEFGTIGTNTKSIFKRLKILMQASPKLSITLHTFLLEENLDWKAIKGQINNFKFLKAFNDLVTHRVNYRFVRTFYNLIKSEQRRKHVSIIVHTRRDARILNIVNSFKNVYHHPLAYLTLETREEALNTVNKDKFQEIKAIPENSKVLGCFGFIGEYKGIDTAIRALTLLPNDYYLVIFGGVHPSIIKKGVKINPYIQTLIDNISPKQKVTEFLSTPGTNLHFSINEKMLLDLQQFKSINDLSDRVIFAGAVSDSDFASAMSLCDIVLLPYHEVGQSSSGPMSLAVDVGANILASRTKTFMQFEKYHPNRFKMFEQSNYLHLAQLIRTTETGIRFDYPEQYNVKSNVETYVKASGLNI